MTVSGPDPDDWPQHRYERYQPPRLWPRRLLLGAAALAAAFVVYLGVLIVTTPGVDALRAASTARASVIVSSDGEVIGRFASAYQAPIGLDEVAPVVVQALIATEDHRFYDHHGLDPQRIVSSAWQTLWGDLQGASTLTQQLARNLFPQQIGNRRTLQRKLREAITAVRLERHSDKAQILEAYLNTAPFLYNVRGFGMAAQTYFDTSAAELDAAQAATLVGMLKGSHRYNPVRHPQRALDRRNVVLAQMHKRGVIDEAEYARLKARPLGLQFRRPEDGEIGQARHFVVQVREQIVDWADSRDVDLDRDGLIIHTTLDSRLQQLAQQAVSEQVAALQRLAGREWSQPRLVSTGLKQGEAKNPFAWFWRANPEFAKQVLRDSAEFRVAREAGLSEQQALAKLQADDALVRRLREEKTRLSAGFVAMEPGSGAVRAWIGSPDFGTDQFDHVAQARRQPGSTFKPFVYGAAIARGISTAHQYLDDLIEIPLGGGRVWRPTDMGGPSRLPMTLREGLVHSKNSVTARVMLDVGASQVMRFARAAGVRSSPLDPVPSLALGTSPVTLLEMVTAYSTLAALGEYNEPRLLTHITDRDGTVLARFDDERSPEYSIERGVAEKLVDAMRGVIDEGTGAGLRREFGVRGDLAGKTGTTQNNTDGWFIAMNPALVAGAWVGFNDQRVTIRSNYWGQGAHNALRIVGDFLRSGQRAKLLDFSATFPIVVRPEPEPPPIDPLQRYWDERAREQIEAPPVIPVLPMSSIDSWRSDRRP
ncbi:transglycosylase domain-containing protein [Piscinibacter sakaiensis]|uniref:transglycosylase domain-containing protein n=1 Tax=Piscinibacter sakaiensis TaxID=1547922 RepID=UPI003AAA8444